MLSKIAFRFIRAAAPLVVLLVLLSSSIARADNVDTLVRQLGDSSDKIRLAAALKGAP